MVCKNANFCMSDEVGCMEWMLSTSWLVLFGDNRIWEQLRGGVISSWGQEHTLLLFSIPLADSWTLLIDLGSKWIQLSSIRKNYGGKVVRGIHQISGSSCSLCCEMCGIYNGYLAAKQVGFFFFFGRWALSILWITKSNSCENAHT